MAIHDAHEFADLRSYNVPLLGMDLGTKTIGLAVCDPGWSIASPLETIKRTKFNEDVAALSSICIQREIGGLVIGLPLNGDGTIGPRAQSTNQFARNILRVGAFADYPILLWDERFSTQLAEDFMIDELNLSRAKRKTRIDMLAAQVILQDFLQFSEQNQIIKD